MARTALALLLVTVIFSSFPLNGPAAGPPLYPDLVTLAPGGLYIERGSDGRYRLRFDNTVGNYGGRLEMTVDGNRDIYQNVYDQWTGGARVARQKIASDLIFHPEHNHFHFQDFARYELLKQDRAGVFRATTRRGSKTSFCILDFERLTTNGPSAAQYTTCGANIQGLSAGWGDTYYGSLPEQWIDLGSATLADGAYAIRSTADPFNKIIEANDGNNVGVTYFSVVNGRLTISGAPTLCTASPDRGPVGTVTMLSCSGFNAGESIDIYWGSTSTTPKLTVTATSTGKISRSFTIPESDIGNHYIIAKGRTSGKQGAALFNTSASIALSQTSGAVGTTLEVSLRGFGAGESIAVRYFTTTSAYQQVVTAVASPSGSATAVFSVPASVYGSHKVEAYAQASGSRVSTTFSVGSTMTLLPSTTGAGEPFGVSLRGFGGRESVRITLSTNGALLGALTTSTSGSTTASSARIVAPPATSAGSYEIVATGVNTGTSARATLTVTAAAIASAPTVTATATATVTATATESATATPTETATVTVTESPSPTETIPPTEPPAPTSTETIPPQNASPVANAGEDILAIDRNGDGEESVVLDARASFDPDGQVDLISWTIGDETVSTKLVDAIRLGVGVHTVTLTITDDQGAVATDEIIITIVPGS